MIRLLLVLLLSGCAAVRSYDAELYTTLERASGGAVDDAIKLLEANNRLPDKDLLYYLERGMLERLGGRYGESQKTWMAASARMQASARGRNPSPAPGSVCRSRRRSDCST